MTYSLREKNRDRGDSYQLSPVNRLPVKSLREFCAKEVKELLCNCKVQRRSKVGRATSLWRGRCPRCRWRGYSSRCPPSASGSPAPRWSPSRTLSSYIWVHDRAVQAADDRLPKVGGPGDQEGHGEQEEGGGGVQLQHQVLRRQRGGGEASQVAKHLVRFYNIFP